MNNGSTYTPREGSVAYRAHLELSARGPMSGQALADAIDYEPAATLMQAITIALREGYIAKEKRNGLNFYSVGNGVPPAREPDDDPPAQRVVPAAQAAPMAFTQVPRILPLPPPAPSNVQRLAAQPAAFRCGLWSTGELVIERGDEQFVCTRDECDLIVRFLDRLATPEQGTVA